MVVEIGVIGFADDNGKDLVHILAVDAVIADERVLLVVAELFVPLQVAEHGAVAHIVTVNNGIVGGLFLIDAEIDIGDTPVVLLEVDIGAVVFIIILRLHDGVIQLGIGDLDPAGDIGVALIQSLEARNIVIGVAVLIHGAGIGGIGVVKVRQLIGELAVIDGLHLIAQNVDERSGKYHHAQSECRNADLVTFGERLHLDALNEVGAPDRLGTGGFGGRTGFDAALIFHGGF